MESTHSYLYIRLPGSVHILQIVGRPSSEDVTNLKAAKGGTKCVWCWYATYHWLQCTYSRHPALQSSHRTVFIRPFM